MGVLREAYSGLEGIHIMFLPGLGVCHKGASPILVPNLVGLNTAGMVALSMTALVRGELKNPR